jgi:PAT family beta-lactamase induction signal transducer AmpG
MPARENTVSLAPQPVPERVASVWWWIPSLYFGQGIPYVVVMTLSVILYKNLGLSNTEIALYTSWLYLPFVIKPLWAPFVDLFKTKRWWVVTLELLIGALFASVALALPLPGYFQITLLLFWLLAFSGATHDISSDGFYMLGLNAHEQVAYVGIRSTFFRLSMITGQGALVYLAGKLTERTGDVVLAWSVVFFVLGAMFAAMSLYHRIVLPRPTEDVAHGDAGRLLQSFVDVFAKFLQKKDVLLALAYFLFYRFGEAQLVKMAPPFLLDLRSRGGLELSTANVGVIYGTVGMIALTLGGLLSAWLVARDGLLRWRWPMALAINVPHLVYVYLALMLPSDVLLIGAAVAFEQFGYGFGFTAFVLVMIMTAAGEHKTAHYAICTGFMALGMMLPGMASGWLQSQLGYAHFFTWICVAAVPTFIVTALIKVDPEFGTQKK